MTELVFAWVWVTCLSSIAFGCFVVSLKIKDERKRITLEREWYTKSLAQLAAENAILLDKLLEARTRERKWRDAWKSVTTMDTLPQDRSRHCEWMVFGCVPDKDE